MSINRTFISVSLKNENKPKHFRDLVCLGWYMQLIPRQDQPLQPPGILIFVAVWAKDGLADSWTIAGFSVCAGMHSTHFTNLLYLLEIFQSFTPFPCNCRACCFQCHCKRS